MTLMQSCLGLSKEAEKRGGHQAFTLLQLNLTPFPLSFTQWDREGDPALEGPP